MAAVIYYMLVRTNSIIIRLRTGVSVLLLMYLFRYVWPGRANHRDHRFLFYVQPQSA